MSETTLYALVLAGGSGTRLWPYSRRARPKQFLSVAGGATMLQATVQRVQPLIPPERVLVVTGQAHLELVRAQLPSVPSENIIVEPSGRGTAPAIGLAALHLQQREPGAAMAVLSVDRAVTEREAFQAALAFGLQLAREGHLVTFGVPPTHPSDAYGYIQRGQVVQRREGLTAARVRAFAEKPTPARAAQYLAQGDYLWNVGTFVWRVDRLLDEIEQHCPPLARALAEVGAAMGAPQARDRVAALWPGVPSLPIDVAVLERTSTALVITTPFGWRDLGDWAALADSLPQDEAGNAIVGEHLGEGTQSSLIHSPERLVATCGVEDLLIIDTPDVVLVCHRSRSQEIKALLAALPPSLHHLK